MPDEGGIDLTWVGEELEKMTFRFLSSGAELTIVLFSER